MGGYSNMPRRDWRSDLMVVVATIVALPIMFFIAMWVIGGTIESIGEHSEARDRCLKGATNGYEIKRCR